MENHVNLASLFYNPNETDACLALSNLLSAIAKFLSPLIFVALHEEASCLSLSEGFQNSPTRNNYRTSFSVLTIFMIFK